jgi:hypothetical protein
VRQTMAAAAAAAAAASGPSSQAPHGQAQPYVHASLPVVMLPGEGPLEIDYSVCGEHAARWPGSTHTHTHTHTHTQRSAPPLPNTRAHTHTHAGGKEVVISRKTGEAVLRGAPVYAPGMLACSSGVEVRRACVSEKLKNIGDFTLPRHFVSLFDQPRSL